MSFEDDELMFDEEHLQSRLALMRQYIARPIPQQPWDDSMPALIPLHEGDAASEGGIIIAGSKHAANIPLLQSMNVTAVLNCASGGIARLPVDELKKCGIRYAFTNCRQDSYTYPILHETKSVAKRPDNLQRMLEGKTGDTQQRIIVSQHLEVSSALFSDIRRQNINSARKGRKNICTRSNSSGEGRPHITGPGNVVFFCVAGQNRSAALAAATLMLHGKPLEDILRHCARQRPFVLENVGFQRQLVELEAIICKLKPRNATQLLRDQLTSHWDLIKQAKSSSEQNKRFRIMDGSEDEKLMALTNRPKASLSYSESEGELLAGTKVEVELLIPGLCTMEVRIPTECTIATLKQSLVQHANTNLLRYDEHPSKIAKAWVVLAMFGYDDMYDVPLEVEAVEMKVQLKRIKQMFGLTARLKDGEPHVTWNERCRFALVIFSVVRAPAVSESVPNGATEMEIDLGATGDGVDLSKHPDQVPWTFVHEERPNAPATLLQNTLRSTHLRAWDFVTGESLASKLPIVFSFAEDPRDKRAFMRVSRCADQLLQFHAPGEGDILGMGENAIVHRVQLSFTQADGGHRDEHWTKVNVGLENQQPKDKSSNNSDEDDNDSSHEDWDAAVKRPFSLGKMLVFLQHSSEAGLAKRLRLANLLNSDKRVLYFYGLGLGLSTDAYNTNQYKFELMLLAKYCETFSTYTMRCFMDEYTTAQSSVTNVAQRLSLKKMQSDFSITSVKVFLVSLLNGFRDLTLMGVQAFDFNHLNNVLVSRDYQSVRLIDIDGNAQGSIDYPSLQKTFANGKMTRPPAKPPQKPCLHVDLNILLPSVIEQLILGKGRGRSFVSNTRSEIWRAKEEDGKAIIRGVLMENFYPGVENQAAEVEVKGKEQIHVTKVAEWFYALLKKQSPWTNWTNDIYDAMRCIDHLPIS
mmetsp:Transcript_3614/g.7970  ORF Transcript_3614/g.7970 Transcript_3614/m.7970 type:complete len:919 (-) Transcript_3614:41-2797(-)